MTQNNFARVMFTLLFVFSGGAIATETLNVGGYSGSIEQVFKEKIIPTFEAKTGAKVKYFPGNSTDTLAKLQSQRLGQELSVAFIDDGPMQMAVDQRLCSKLQTNELGQDLYQNALMSGGRSLGVGLIATGLVYNKKIFRENHWSAPSAWADLGDSKYKQKIVIPPINNGYGMLTLIMLSKINGGSEKKMEPGFTFLQKAVSPNVMAWEASPNKMAQMLQSGEAPIGVWGNGRVQALVDQGAPLEFVYPKEGAVLIMTAGCVVEGAPQAKLGLQFLQHVLASDSQAILATSLGWGPTNKKVLLPPEVARKVVYGSDRVNSLVLPNYEIINSKRSEWTRSWYRATEY